MMEQGHSRYIQFESVPNFRDLGGYRTLDGKTTGWGRVFRSGELCRMTDSDFARLTQEIRINTVLDLRDRIELEKQGTGRVAESGMKYFNVPFTVGDGSRDPDMERFKSFTNMGEVYLYFFRHQAYGRQVVKALEIIAEPANHPLVFHCAAGKDRTGVLAAATLSVLGVPDEDIIKDYTLTTPFMKELIDHLNNNPGIVDRADSLPDYFWTSNAESMELFLTALRREFGSVKGYLEAHGAEAGLFDRLREALLE
jgi:protein-tyrosine phosphatase